MSTLLNIHEFFESDYIVTFVFNLIILQAAQCLWKYNSTLSCNNKYMINTFTKSQTIFGVHHSLPRTATLPSGMAHSARGFGGF